MTKLEEIARAICTARERNGGPPWEYWLSQPDGKHVLNACMDDARAAVEALRLTDDIEPMWLTGAPEKAGIMAGDYKMAAHEASGAWNAMILAILNEKPE